MKKFIVKKVEKKEYVQLTCRFEEELLDKINKIVLENNLYSRNSFINDCLRFALENMEFEN